MFAADCGCYCNDKLFQLSLVILSILTHSSCVSGIHIYPILFQLIACSMYPILPQLIVSGIRIQYYPNSLLMPIANTTYKPLSHYYLVNLSCQYDLCLFFA